MTTPIQGFRLSPQQRHLWLLSQTSEMYSAQCSVFIKNTLDKTLLQNALKRVITQHEILRTTFQRPIEMKFPLQVITEHNTLQWQEFDLSTENVDVYSTVIKEKMYSDRLQPFDFVQGPLLHATLLRLGPTNHLLLLTLSALCADSRSLQNLIQAINHSYNDCLLGHTDNTKRLQYIQFSEWQNELMEEDAAAEGKAYWQRQKDLFSSPPFILPFEHISSSSLDGGFDTSSVTIDLDITVALKKISDAHHVPLSTVLLACWQILLWQQSKQEHIIVNCQFDGRKYEELENMIGPCMKSLPVSTHVAPNLTFSDLLQQIQQKINEINDLQEYFFSESSEVSIRSVQGPLCSFEFIDQTSVSEEDGISFTLQLQLVCIAPYNVKLICTQSGPSLKAELSYDTKRFHPETIHALLEEFATLAAHVGREPTRQVKVFSSLSLAERQRLVVHINQTQKDYPPEQSVYHLFEKQAIRTPDVLAIVFQQQRISYAELHRQVQLLANYLQNLGIGPEVCVGIYLERSPEFILSLLGVLKAGGAYVPLETSLPYKRLQFMLADTQACVVLTSSKWIAHLPGHTTRMVCLDTDWDKITNAPVNTRSLQRTQASPSTLAYIMYTSGSTGQPKGVMIQQQGLVNYLNWCIETYASPEGHGAPVHSPNGFDLTITSLFTPLLIGQTVLLLPEEQSIEALITALQNNSQFSLMKITPAHLEVLNRQIIASQVATTTRTMVIGGSILWGESVIFWQRHGPAMRLINEYGPTEAVVGCCVYEIQREERIDGPVPIGKPIANMRLYVLDTAMQPVPVGVMGELYIGGIGVGRGYLNRPELTAAQFVPDPFSLEPGMRLYKSGDLVRYAPDGNLHFIGRIDDQVKIRGFRIELGEIEILLALHPEVQEAVVTTRQDSSGEKSLLAYIVPQPKKQPLASDLRTFLQEHLPAYMVPTTFAVLATLPLNANGKIDRTALPEPEKLLAATHGQTIAPRNKIEHIIMRIWQEVLQMEQISMDVNFFDVGGHSLLLVQVSSRLQEELQRKITTLEILEYPTIGALSQYLNQTEDREATLETQNDRAQHLFIGRARLQQRKVRMTDK